MLDFRFIPFDRLRDPIRYSPHCPSTGSGTMLGFRFIPFERLRDHVRFSLYSLRKAQGPFYFLSLLPLTSSGTILDSLFATPRQAQGALPYAVCSLRPMLSALCPMQFPLRQARGPWLRPRAKLKTSKYCRRGNPYPSISVLSTPKCDC